MTEASLGVLIEIWESVKPFVSGFVLFFILIGVIKHVILDDITNKLNALVLAVNESNEHLWNIKNSISTLEKEIWNIKNSISNVEQEMKWWEKNTTASQIIERLNDIERK